MQQIVRILVHEEAGVLVQYSQDDHAHVLQMHDDADGGGFRGEVVLMLELVVDLVWVELAGINAVD
jgi:hypothetical protein